MRSEFYATPTRLIPRGKRDVFFLDRFKATWRSVFLATRDRRSRDRSGIAIQRRVLLYVSPVAKSSRVDDTRCKDAPSYGHDVVISRHDLVPRIESPRRAPVSPPCAFHFPCLCAFCLSHTRIVHVLMRIFETHLPNWMHMVIIWFNSICGFNFFFFWEISYPFINRL